jgi:SNF2 family DNA or RNA helicase
MNVRQREESEAKFLRGDVRIFVSIPAAGGMGMNLQRASYAIYYCNDYSLQNRLQSEDRVHRMGQKRNVTIIDLCCKSTIDYKVLDVLVAKKDIADIITEKKKKNFLQYTVDEDC